MLAFILLIIGAISRLVIHTPNFTPVLALTLLGASVFPRKYAILFPVFLMMATDAILGAHQLVLFTWGSLALIALIGIYLRKRKNPAAILGAGIFSAVLFYIVTNFGVWLMGWYGYSFQGLINCYVAAIPFFRSTLASTLFYSFAFFGIYEVIANRVKETRFAPVLLS